MCIKLRTSRVDIRYPFQSSFHFDKEMFTEGRSIITEGLTAVKASNKKENYEAAREQLGEILHPLQVRLLINLKYCSLKSCSNTIFSFFFPMLKDFYSHSNWVELGNARPNSNLIRAGSSIGNIAGKEVVWSDGWASRQKTNEVRSLRTVLESKQPNAGFCLIRCKQSNVSQLRQ